MGDFANNLTGVIAQPPTIENNTEIYQWQCPAGVTSVSVLVIGGGGAGGANNGGGGMDKYNEIVRYMTKQGNDTELAKIRKLSGLGND
jgi:hypothetical protein